MKAETPILLDEFAAAEERRAASGYVAEAFAEAILCGIEAQSLAHAALTAALQEMVGAHGEDIVAQFVAELPERIRHGEFSLFSTH